MLVNYLIIQMKQLIKIQNIVKDVQAQKKLYIVQNVKQDMNLKIIYALNQSAMQEKEINVKNAK